MFLWTIALMENAEDIPEYAVQVSAKTWNAWENRNKERVRDFVEAVSSHRRTQGPRSL